MKQMSLKRRTQPLRRWLRLEPLEERLQLSSTIVEDFANDSAIALNGVAAISDGRLQLSGATEYTSSSAWFTQTIDPHEFVASFQFEFQHSDGEGLGAGDGFTFAVLDADLDGANSLGDKGEYLGYGKAAGPLLSGFAVEFDTWYNPAEGDPNRIHFGLDVGGSVQSIAVSPISVALLINNGPWRAEIRVDDGQLALRVGQGEDSPLSTVLTAALPPEAIPQSGRVGFTASTGDAVLTTSVDDFGFGPIDQQLINESFDAIPSYFRIQSASQSDGQLLLTNAPYETSAVWFTTPVFHDVVTATFDLQIDNPQGLGWGDGFTFAVVDPLIDRAEGTVGDLGGSLGYAASGLAGVDSGFAVEFDTYQNGSETHDPPYHHIGLDIAGSVDSVAVSDALPFDIAGSGPIRVQITFDTSRVDVFLTADGYPEYHALSATLPVGAFPDVAQLGFTAATASAAQRVRVDNLRVVRNVVPTPTGLRAIAIAPNAVQLAWNRVIATGTYFVDRSMSSAGPFEQIAIRAAGQPQYVDQGPQLVPETTYYYRVRSVDGGVSSSESPVISVTTTADVEFDSGPRIVVPIASSGVASFGDFTSAVDHVDVAFSELIASQSFGPDDVRIAYQPFSHDAASRAPGRQREVTIPASSVEPISGLVYRIHFAAQTAGGTYNVTVGPSVVDLAGNRMNQDNNSTNGELTADRFLASWRILPTEISGTVSHDGTTYPVQIHGWEGSITPIYPDKMTWLVIHGRDSSPDDQSIQGVASTLDSIMEGDQVLIVDWREAAAPQSPIDLGGEEFIQGVADWVARALPSIGITGAMLNIVGHSWGAYVGSEAAERLGRVNSLVALDPARGVVGGFNPDSAGETDFKAHANYSWAFFESGNDFYGSNVTPITADEAFVVTGSSHGDVVYVFSGLVTTSEFGAIFNIDRLLEARDGPMAANEYSESGTLVGSENGEYEAVVATGATAVSVRYLSKVTQEEVTLTISNQNQNNSLVVVPVFNIQDWLPPGHRIEAAAMAQTMGHEPYRRAMESHAVGSVPIKSRSMLMVARKVNVPRAIETEQDSRIEFIDSVLAAWGH